jgi:two-component system C4-dicarboxylate transport sensor histidine kinase DctB
MCLSAACSVALIFFAYLFFAQKKKRNPSGRDRQLQIIALIWSRCRALRDFAVLDFVSAVSAQVLANPADKALVQQLNLTLQDMQQQAKIAAIYLMDAQV